MEAEDELMQMLNGSGDGDTIPSDSPGEDDLPDGLKEAVDGMHNAKTPEERARHFRNAITFCMPEAPAEG